MVADTCAHPEDAKEVEYPSYIPFWRLLVDQQVIKEVLHHQYDGSGTEEDPYVV